MVILGIDPGTATTGFGVIRKIKRDLKCLDYGLIKTSPKSSTPERLDKLYTELTKLIRKHKPDILGVENIYFFKNLKTALPVSQAKGVILLAAARAKVPIYEFTPLQVKMTVTGYGRAEKKQIQKMIGHLLGLKELPKPDDAADALGVAICSALAL